ncbi:MAG: helix-turn-helix domain-containing protein [Dysgonamonadaceae bacterium]|jgi:transcriptional regulator with XRE-family HTH domain|nr:helix-turn-helix domain-containing protein [Dysgonamonadaceae bacterium]
MNTRKRLGKKLAEIRKKAGISTYDIARETGIQSNNITVIEQGKHSVGVERLEKIVNVLGYKVDIVPKKQKKKDAAIF